MYKVFIDGGHGTTGLRIREYLGPRSDIEIIEIDPEERKNISARIEKIKAAVRNLNIVLGAEETRGLLK